MIGVTCIMVSTIFSHAGVHKITYLNSSISDVCQIILIFSLLIKFIFILFADIFYLWEINSITISFLFWQNVLDFKFRDVVNFMSLLAFARFPNEFIPFLFYGFLSNCVSKALPLKGMQSDVFRKYWSNAKGCTSDYKNACFCRIGAGFLFCVSS